MIRNLEYVKETIDLRKDDIQSNEFETNDLLLEDILQALGYNKKRDSGVKAIYSGEANWQISVNGEPRFIVYVYGYMCDDDIHNIPQSVIEFANSNGYEFVVATDGQRLSIFKLGRNIAYIENIFDDSADGLLELLSKNGWNYDKLSELADKINISKDDILSQLTSTEVIEVIASKNNLELTEKIVSFITETIQSFRTADANTESQAEGNTEIASKLEELNSESARLEGIEASLSDREAKVSERETKVTEREAQVSDREAKVSESEAQAGAQAGVQAGVQANVDELTNQKAQLSTEIEELTNTKQQLSSDISDLDQQKADMTQQKSVVETSIAGLNSKKSELVKNIEELTSQKEGLESDIAKAKDELESLSSNSQNSSSTSSDGTELVELKLRNESLESDSNALKEKNSQLESEVSELKKQIEGLSSQGSNDSITKLQGIVDQLREENENLKKSSKDNMYKELRFETEGAYREKIAQLTAEIQEIKATSQGYKDQLDEIERIKAGAEDERIVLGRMLLEAVEDNSELPRTYVGVVDSKLFQIQDITKFVGNCLQELYNVVQFDLMQILFDGDVFKIVQPAVRCDLMINTKQYDIDLEGFSESDIINRVKAVFNKFPNVVFMCKTIGTIDEETFKKQLHATASNESVQVAPVTNNDAIGDVSWDTVPMEDGALFADPNSTVQGENTEGTQYQDIDGIGNTQEQPLTYLGASFRDALSVVSDLNTPVYNIAAIGDSNRLFKIKNETFYDIIVNGVESLISILQSSTNGVFNLQNNDLSLINTKIVHYNDANESSIQIPFTTEFFVNVNSIIDCVDVLVSISQMLGVSDQQAFFYFSANYYENSGYENMFIPGDQLNLERHIDYNELTPVKQVVNCMISGQEIIRLSFIPESAALLEQMIQSTMAFRRTHGKGVSFKELQDMANFIKLRLDETADQFNPDDVIHMLNESMYSEVISSTDDNMSQDRAEFELNNGNKYYIDKQTGYSSMNLLLFLNRILCNDDEVEMRLDLNSTIYNVHRNSTDMSNCGEYLTGKLLMEAIETKTKIIG